MDPKLFVELARYNEWMNKRLYHAASGLDATDRRKDLGAFFGSIHLTLTHLLITDRAWLARLTGDLNEARFPDSAGESISVRSGSQDIYPEFSDLAAARGKTDGRILSFAGSLTTDRLYQSLVYADSDGVRCDHPMWWAVSHLFNHQAHHRGQVTTLLSQLGHDPGVTDFLMYLRNAAQQSAAADTA